MKQSIRNAFSAPLSRGALTFGLVLGLTTVTSAQDEKPPIRPELDDIIQAGVAFRTSGCPGKEAEDVSACDRPYGDSPPSDIASYPFQPDRKDIKKIRRQLGIPNRLI